MAKGKIPQQNPAAPPVVSGRWLLGAIGVVILLALGCSYATLGLLFYQGQWQLILHPAKTITAMPASQGLKFDNVHFDVTEAGVPRLNGWWIPAAPGSHWAQSTILYLHDGEGSLSNTVSDLATWHALGINVFAIDYRGYGQSAGPHPNEARMSADADAAWAYLMGTRHLDPGAIVIYGQGIGASLAAELATRHAPAGVILDGPSETARMIVSWDARARILPLWLLLNERFDPTNALQSLTIPKLFLDRGNAKLRTNQLYRIAAFPKQYFELRGNGYEATLQRFLDGTLH